MIDKFFYCKYKNQNGDLVVDRVTAASPSAAARIIMLRHPLAQLIGTPTEKHPDEASRREVPKASGVNPKVVYSLLGATIVLLLGLVVIFAFKQNKPQVQVVNAKVEDEDTDHDELEGLYSKVSTYLVSIRSKDASGSGFMVRINNRSYLYTCFHCINHVDEVRAKDSSGKELELGELEICYDRDLVRFELLEETGGLEVARKSDMRINSKVIAYGDALGGGVMTQNKGRILAVGADKIEIDAEVLQGDSGGPVINEAGRVVGVVSSGSIDRSIWAKDTRYEKVRKFAERVDCGDWLAVSYEELRNLYAFLLDTHIMVAELREFSKDTDGLSFSKRIVRPFAHDQLYKGNFGYANEINNIYDTWNDMSKAEDERLRLWDKTNGKVGTRIDENIYFQVKKRRNVLLRQSCW